jgi:hypothetical protein
MRTIVDTYRVRYPDGVTEPQAGGAPAERMAGSWLIVWQSGCWVPATGLGLALAMGRWGWREKRLRAILPITVAAGIWGITCP